jgi:hypothetical protein
LSDNTIYVYTTQTYKENGWYKIGQTTLDAAERVKQQDSTSNPEALILLDSWDACGKSDIEFHKFIESNGMSKTRDNREWFNIPNGLNDIKTLWNKFVSNIARRDSYDMRPHQQECHDKAIHALTGLGYDSFLIGAVMRFGKTFTSYQIMKSLGSKNTIIVTYKPNDVKEAWRSELDNHVDFHDYQFFVANESDYEDISSCEKNVVLFVSAQYLINESGSADKEWIYSLDTDLLIVDEQHFGGATDKFTDMIGRIEPKKKIELSGTPYKTYARGKYPEDCVYRYSKIDLHMKTYCIDLAADIVGLSEAAGFIDGDAFNIDKFFAAENGNFVFPQKVEDTMMKIFGVNPFQAGLNLISPFHVRGLDRNNLDHILIRLPGVQSCLAMKKMISKIAPNYEVIFAAGKSSEAIISSRELINIIERSDKTVTLTCGRFETGITVPEWGSVFVLHGGSAPESYYQTAFRACSKNEALNKEEFYVFDFDPSRVLELTYVSSQIVKKPGQPMVDAVSHYFDCASIYVSDGNKFAEVDSTEVIRHWEDVVSVRDISKAISSEYGMNQGFLSVGAIKALASVNAAKANALKSVLYDNGMAKGKVKKQVAKKATAAQKKELKKLVEKMKTVCKRVPMVVIAEEHPDLHSLFDSGDPTGYFKMVTGVSLEVYREMIDSGSLDYEWQNTCIISIHNNSSMIQPEVY